MGPITDMMYKHSARGLSSKSEIMKNDTHNGMRHVFVCRALTILKRFYGKGIDYRNIERDLDELGLRQIEQVEIILNLDKAGKNVKAEVSDLLSPFFKD